MSDGLPKRVEATRVGGNQMAFIQLMANNKNNNDKNKVIDRSEVKKHNKEGDCWVILNNKVYDITYYFDFHPGGKEILLPLGGKDITREFNKHHQWVSGESLLDGVRVGIVNDNRTGGSRKLLSVGENDTQ
eukprot:GHVR01016368.1.p1 GENE.GHVR01016368.1~~GHVR01016368.1.p1  ORF type:complete len:131 (+),score=34.29 GHVR01016368.1:231-623(+)